ncbi:MAG: methyltransferase domain-containing protein [Shewanella sp.]|nr:methyltransferase domain-containing protein [Shewanella sp.]MCF1430868.1 methyltransferase domain-containing protein [Shewanella sp.]MCF1437342.1 methyltransferase domain-containing protein [Shewanella sp.]MCF1457499.1 methyltransferase domain-containing protein [Shewanella sp.]
MPRCPLCQNRYPSRFFTDKKRSYFRCPGCQLVFADLHSQLPPQVQKQRFNKLNPTKQKQLSLFINVLTEQLAGITSEPLIGLNFGGFLPSSVLTLLQQQGHTLNQYDPFLAPDLAALRQSYDFVCSYRVFEHFNYPLREWGLLCRTLKPGGFLAISTRLLTDPRQFAKWHYKNNPAHVSFYCQKTFDYLAVHHGFTLLFAANDLILMQKAAGSDIKRTP